MSGLELVRPGVVPGPGVDPVAPGLALFPAGGTVLVLSDDFTAADGTAITALAPPWTKHATASSNTAAPTVQANRIVGENAATISTYYRADWVPPTADYDVEAVVVLISDNDASNVGPVGRLVAGANTYYVFRYVTLGNVWGLYKIVAGSLTQLGSTVGQTLTVGQGYVARLSMRGSQISASVNGALVTSAVDAAIGGAGSAGIRLQGAAAAAAGAHLDRWSVWV